ncbi:hypothetical protein QNH10_04095 [Sporosarcina thermotolerans]|uniref:hypothetical protein n=2 Tax=Sporosarcina thermotolerans TaxID=633404 RepID=UPI0024BC61C8|nr:hypothetical protein [Sporosarcina thermotolerans]WHT48902.1 hypothetical protein QNH10_04095 [Sporosarcina thermotolerans]
MMMQHGQCGGRCGGRCGGQCGFPQMMMPVNQMPQTQFQPIVCPTQCRFNDQFFPVEVPYVHPIVNVNRQHPVITPRHYYTETTENVMGAPVFPGRGPGFGGGRGFDGGRGFGGFGRRPY